MSFVFFVVFGPDRTLAGNEGNQHVICAVYLEILGISPFPYKSAFPSESIFLCVKFAIIKRFPSGISMCVEGDFLTESTEVTRMEREKESSELASRVELFVVRSAAGFPIDF